MVHIGGPVLFWRLIREEYSMVRLRLSCEKDKGLRRDPHLGKSYCLFPQWSRKTGVSELEKGKSPMSNFWNYHVKNVCSNPSKRMLFLSWICVSVDKLWPALWELRILYFVHLIPFISATKVCDMGWRKLHFRTLLQDFGYDCHSWMWILWTVQWCLPCTHLI